MDDYLKIEGIIEGKLFKIQVKFEDLLVESDTKTMVKSCLNQFELAINRWLDLEKPEIKE